jgi:7,8-dihydropterin-6-yl-methyl-4-(beta-D-ribofuranosyl)aminobenzene 5'-phosphate synthase
MINIIRRGLAVTGAQKLAGWVGGTHLGPASAEEQEQTLDELLSLEPEFVAANHCTALPMTVRLINILGPRYRPAFVGSVIEC